ncbi:hypothetical protein SEVIR_2G361950v4 [Setaria viridis]
MCEQSVLFLLDRRVIDSAVTNWEAKLCVLESLQCPLLNRRRGRWSCSRSACWLLPDVNMIITDYWMPGMTGYELLKHVKESSKLKEIPVVIMSSENVPNRITRCLEEGAEDFLLKPVRPSDVSRLCSRIR